MPQEQKSRKAKVQPKTAIVFQDSEPVNEVAHIRKIDHDGMVRISRDKIQTGVKIYPGKLAKAPQLQMFYSGH